MNTYPTLTMEEVWEIRKTPTKWLEGKIYNIKGEYKQWKLKNDVDTLEDMDYWQLKTASHFHDKLQCIYDTLEWRKVSQ